MIDRRLITNFDWTLLGSTLLLIFLGVLNLYSASYSFSSGSTPVFLKQVYYMLMGLAAILVILQIDYKNLERYAYWIYGFSVLLLVAVLVVGKTGGGARRWIGIGGLTYQPSELMKLSLIIAGTLAAGSVPVLWQFMKDYQKKRLMTFLNPEFDALGSGYHIIQSKR